MLEICHSDNSEKSHPVHYYGALKLLARNGSLYSEAHLELLACDRLLNPPSRPHADT